MAIFNSYVKLPEGIFHHIQVHWCKKLSSETVVVPAMVPAMVIEQAWEDNLMWNSWEH